jgi:hypothetical protein
MIIGGLLPENANRYREHANIIGMTPAEWSKSLDDPAWHGHARGD